MPAQSSRHRETAEDLIREAQGILGHYLEPDSGLSADACINRLLDVLDGPAAAAITRRSAYGGEVTGEAADPRPSGRTIVRTSA